MSNDSSINEGLERIGISLQQLIQEAQASLSKIPSHSASQSQQQHFNTVPSSPPSSAVVSQNDTSTEETAISIEEQGGFANYSYQYVQKRYLQSQEKLTVAIEQLEHSIQNLTFATNHNKNNTSINHTKHHHYVNISSSSTIPSKKKHQDKGEEGQTAVVAKGKRYPIPAVVGIVGILLTTLVMSLRAPNSHNHPTSPSQRKYDTLLSVALLFCSIHCKRKQKKVAIHYLDRFIIRMSFQHRMTTFISFLLKYFHQANICLHSYHLINHCLLLLQR